MRSQSMSSSRSAGMGGHCVVIAPAPAEPAPSRGA
jgi:hypothetical protein